MYCKFRIENSVLFYYFHIILMIWIYFCIPLIKLFNKSYKFRFNLNINNIILRFTIILYCILKYLFLYIRKLFLSF